MKILSLISTTCLVFILFPKNVLAAISFQISNLEKSAGFYSVDAVVSGIASSSACFVQVALTSSATPRYFGKTWSQKGEWISYTSSPEKEYIRENFIKLENDVSTKILFNTDPDDPDYKGPGEYLVKLKRYTGDSTSSAGESNTLTLTISDPTPTATATTIAPTQTATKTPTPTITPTKTPTPTNANTPTKAPTPTVIATKTPTQTNSPTRSVPSPEVLAESTSSATLSAKLITPEDISPTITYKPQKSNNHKLPFFVGIATTALSGGLLYFRHRKD